jgi:hypothetical protein
MQSNTTTVAATSFTINEIVSSYLKQNALVKMMIQRSCKRRKGLYAILNSTDTKSLDAKLKNMLILPMMRRSIEHIGDNSGKIEHQREHLC